MRIPLGGYTRPPEGWMTLMCGGAHLREGWVVESDGRWVPIVKKTTTEFSTGRPTVFRVWLDWGDRMEFRELLQDKQFDDSPVFGEVGRFPAGWVRAARPFTTDADVELDRSMKAEEYVVG